MIESVQITNYVGESVKIVLTDDNPTHGLLIKKIDGLGPSAATISKTVYGIIPGSFVSNSVIPEKNIVITFLLSNECISIEEARLNIYKYLPINQELEFQIKTGDGVFKINGLVESCEPDIFSKDESVVVSILCPSPFFIKTANAGEADDYTVDLASTGTDIVNDSAEDFGVEVEFILDEVYFDHCSPQNGIIYIAISGGQYKYMVLNTEVIGDTFSDFAERGYKRGDKITFYHFGNVVYCRYYYTKSYGGDNPEWYEPYDVTSCLVQNDEISVPALATRKIIYGNVVTNQGRQCFYVIAKANYKKGPGSIGTGQFINNSCTINYGGDTETGGIWTIRFTNAYTISGTSHTFTIQDGKGKAFSMDLVKIFKIINTQTHAFATGDVIELSTVDGDKHLSFKRGNTTYNVLDAAGAVEYRWPRLYYGINNLHLVNIDNTKIDATIEYGEMHGGV